MSKEQVIYRILANEIEISNTRLKTGQIYENDWAQIETAIAEALQNILKLPLREP